MIKLLIVDDSAFMRMVIKKMVSVDANIKVVGEAKNGELAVKMAQELRPSIITMDVEMPVMDGVSAVGQIMDTMPCPIIMVSSLTTEGASATLDALAKGAVDVIAKSSSFVQLDIVKIEQELLSKIRHWTNGLFFLQRSQQLLQNRRHTSTSPSLQASPAPKVRKPTGVPDLIVIGVSTGGPKVIPELLKSIEKIRCPIVIAQHMPAFFTASFAEYLNSLGEFEAREGEDGMQLKPGCVVVAPGSQNSRVRRKLDGSLTLEVRAGPKSLLSPSVDILFYSAVEAAVNPVAVILTGMGQDGMEGCQRFAEKGFPVLVQEPSSCVVDGMTTSVIEAGAASEVKSILQIGNRLSSWAV